MDKGDENLIKTAPESENYGETFDISKNKTADFVVKADDNGDKPRFFAPLFSIFNARPFLSGAIGFIIGIFAVYYSICFGFYVALAVAVIAVVLCVFALKFAKDKSKKACAVIFAALILLGGIRAFISAADYFSCKNYGGTVDFSGRVERVFVNGNQVCFEVSNGYARGEKLKGAAYVYVFKNRINGVIPSKYDVIQLKATLKRATDLDGGETKAKYFASGVYYMASGESKVKVAGQNRNFFENCRAYVEKYIKSAYSEQNYGVMLALTVGDTSALSEETANAFRLSGLAHVFAVSGLHIGLFSSLFLLLSKLLKLKRFKKCALVLIPTLFYVGICGFSSSSVRAFIMLAVILLSQQIGFKHDKLSALSIAALIITFISPRSAFNKGWQLSFSAIAGIFLLSPVLKRGTKPLPEIFGESVSVSLAAQLGTLPILTDMCGYMSIIAPFANLIMLPIISIIYQITAVLCLIGIPLFALGAGENAFKIISFLPDNALSAISAIITAVNYEKLIIPFTFGAAAVPYYFALITVADVTNLKMKRKIMLFAALFCCACVLFAIK